VKLTPRKIFVGTALHTCKNCGHPFKGKVCNMCGEKVFNEKQLSAKHFIHEAIDFFWHWESKVLKTISLNFLKPGFVTKQNLEGITVPYAKPVQLYLVVAFAFYIIVGLQKVTDYVPNVGDHYYYEVSDYSLFKWAKPIDKWVVNSIDTMWVNKGKEIQKDLEEELVVGENKNTYTIYGRQKLDSILIPNKQLPVLAFRQMTEIRDRVFKNKIGTYSKSLVFILLPVFAGFFYLFFYQKIKFYGASLILATHFMVYNFCIYCLNTVFSSSRLYFSESYRGWLMKPFDWLFFNSYMAPVSNYLFGGTFEFFHILFWMPWFLIAFKRLFNVSWWKNILIAYCCSRVFFYLIFGVLKKLMIAFAIYSIHA
jgi:hypothetical protein